MSKPEETPFLKKPSQERRFVVVVCFNFYGYSLRVDRADYIVVVEVSDSLSLRCSDCRKLGKLRLLKKRSSKKTFAYSAENLESCGCSKRDLRRRHSHTLQKTWKKTFTYSRYNASDTKDCCIQRTVCLRVCWKSILRARVIGVKGLREEPAT